MKKLAVLAMAIGVFNCQSDLDETPQELSTPINDDVISVLESLDYDTETIPVYNLGEDYIVEGDISISQDEIDTMLSEKQRRTRSLISCNNRLNITIKNDLTGIYSTALIAAVNNWNTNSNNLVNLTIVTSNATTTARFLQSTETVRSGTAATAAGPRNGRAGDLIRVNTGFRATASLWETILTHEIGHTLGFAHTDSRNATFIRGSLRSDPNSVMNSGGNAGCCISTGDTNALSLLYGNCNSRR